jgi:CheY-like chemotaxis protein
MRSASLSIAQIVIALVVDKVADKGDTMDAAESDEVRVLLVEDDAALAQMYRIKLERDGYTVRVAGDGEAALRLLEDELPDLIFLDVRLPHMDGLAFLEHLRSDLRTQNLPVVIVSNYSEEELIARGLQLGVLEYLIKSQTTPGQLSHGVPDWSRPYVYPGETAEATRDI